MEPTTEVRKQSVKRITKPECIDLVGNVIPNGLYDPAMGPLEGAGICPSCGERSLLCPGHCGHIELPLPVYNPLLFKFLFQFLKGTCIFCHHFLVEQAKVYFLGWTSGTHQKGDITGAKALGLDECSYEEESDVESMGGTTKLSDERCLNLELPNWTCLQYKEAMSASDVLFKAKTNRKCSRCEKKNPKITCPNFGWFRSDMGEHSIRANVILGIEPDAPSNDEAVHNGTSSSAKESTRNKKGSAPPAEYIEQKTLCNRDLSPEKSSTSEKKNSYSMFFIDALLVAPVKFRPPTKGGGREREHPQTELLREVVTFSETLEFSVDPNKVDATGTKEKINEEDVTKLWMKLQNSVNILFDSKAAKGSKNKSVKGICQLLEKKDGMVRQHMMGKRVDFTCRSVISPDPYLAVNEIGIPRFFAEGLTYPERVTPWNVNKLRDAILNGNATHYMENCKVVRLNPKNVISRMACARKSTDQDFGGKVIFRHLEDGDVVLVNRQPSLHKPSIMAHIVRVLEGEKTLRLHYANCRINTVVFVFSVYNADFDGDEMNVRFPQDEISRAEAYNIVNANNQYIVPTSGEPKRGLIQDHIVSAVLLTKKDTFLTRDEFYYLLYGSGVSAAVRCSINGRPRKKISVISTEDEIQDIPPTIWRPEPLWTGKQVITSILNHITRTRGLTPLTIEKSGKIPNNYFVEESKEGNGSEKRKISEELKLRIQKNELVHGVIDKNQFGSYGLVHMVQELYGLDVAGIFLSVLSRLFTLYLQMHGFTCGIDDLLVHQMRPKKGWKNSEKVKQRVKKYTLCLLVLMMDIQIEKTIRTNGETATTRLDRMMSSSLNGITSEVNDMLFPNGLQKSFPKNCLSVMTISGAKGSTVNFSQISSLLGQQKLEGKRVPRMISGKTLPSFHPWDPASRAGGFIGDRFLTGLRPQEYYFHCMAGREGLVDTAVKTSRSGYLQRCLIKSLESLKVCYDLTVRDADGSVVQFFYGEDGVDTHKTSFISEFNIIAENQNAVLENIGGEFEDSQLMECGDYVKDMPMALEGKTNDFISDFKKREQLDSSQLMKRTEFLKLMKLKYLSSLAQPGEPVGIIAAQSIGEPSTQMTLNTFHHAGRGDMNVTLGVPRLQEILMRASAKILSPAMICPFQKEKTENITHRLAAASNEIPTVGNIINIVEVQSLAAKFKKVTVADIIESMEVHLVPCFTHNGQVSTLYKLKIKVHQPEDFPPYMDIKLEDCMQTLDVLFVRELEDMIHSHLKLLSRISGIHKIAGVESGFVSETELKEDEDESGKKSQQVGEDSDDNGEDDDDDDYEAEDLDGDAQKRKQQTTDEIDYDEDGMEPEASVVENLDTDSDKGDDHISEGEAQASDAEDEQKSIPMPKKSKPEENKAGPDGNPKKVTKARGVQKKFDRNIFTETTGLDFEVHLIFSPKEPHILLSEIAKKAAKNVYIRRPGTIQKCSAFEYKDPIYANEKGYQGEPALQTVGVCFSAFWNLVDDLDVNRIVSNDIQAVLRTYGVEAARATLLNEVKGVFKAYSIAVDIRHLYLIADYMTHEGGIRPFSRYGLAGSISPFSKMTFETASKFIVDAAYHGEVDSLESASARICLGLPVKMGTGSFDVLQQI
ncbi:hypothetical protein MKW98_003804 [Papaver atlanticum]|uniref:DNA-directed RNA polymerase subunit n=1 Tax=Papaver atlanticum TaxID=357466 RepID=A0AAD4T5T6_9MAGN|nr:hypothetical protein MKW98_003804 [Papaver atlanticum]